MRTVPARFVAALTLTLCLGLAHGRADKPQTSSQAIYCRTLRGTALVLVKPQGKLIAAGSGWVADARRRLLVTNHHVVKNQEAVWVVFPAYRGARVIAEKTYYFKNVRPIRGKVLDSDPARDLAVIQLETLPRGVRALRPAPRSPDPGQTLHSLGNPGASAAFWVYTKGAVRTVVRRQIPYDNGQQLVDTTVIETTSPNNPGDSGGPVVDDRGRVVGVTSGGNEAARLVSFCIDVTVVKKFLGEVRALQNPRTAPPRAFLLRGNRYNARRLYDRAVADFNLALRHRRAGSRLRAVIYRQRGLALYNQGACDRALADLGRALRLNPKDAAAFNIRGHALRRLGKLDQAVGSYSRAIELQPRLAYLYQNRGGAYMAKRSYEEAIADFSKSLELAPAARLALLNRGVCFYRRRDYPRALADLNGAIRSFPRHPYAYYWKGATHEALDLFGKAQADYRQAIKLAPKLAKAIPLHNHFHLKLVNKSGQTLKVYLRYETWSAAAKGWQWLPGGPGETLVIELAPGASVDVHASGSRIAARKLRFWAVGEKGGKWFHWKDRDLVLVKDGYRSFKRWTYNYNFLP
jgi:tetratricopeptide (TPR) repeat protein